MRALLTHLDNKHGAAILTLSHTEHGLAHYSHTVYSAIHGYVEWYEYWFPTVPGD